MNPETLRTMLENLAAGRLTIDQALDRLKLLPFEDAGFARIDHHRQLRSGAPEVIYCPGKTTEQVVEIAGRMNDAGVDVIATRADDDVLDALQQRWEHTVVHKAARIATLLQPERPDPVGNILVCCGGTSDIPVAEEARVTAESLGNRVGTAYDVGVAGLHRLLANTAEIQRANVVVVVAGMEGALASVVGGLAPCPVLAVPTSVGYGASLGGVAALLTMLNSCAPSVSVVNIDNGFGAGYIASLINRRAAGSSTEHEPRS